MRALSVRALACCSPRLDDAHRVVETDDQVVLLDDLADLDRDFLDDAGLARLDDLGLRRRNDLAVAARDLVDLGIGGPDDEGDEERAYDEH